MNKELKFGNDARSAIKEGIDILAEAVGSTLGPKGNCVVIGNYRQGNPHVTKDGVTVAKNINFSDNYKQVGAQLIREASLKTVAEVGDSTTSATVMAHAFINEADNFIKDGHNPVLMKKGVADMTGKVIDYIRSNAKPISENDYESIATISANNDPEIGKLVADVFKKVTAEGVIIVEESQDVNTKVETINGMRFDRGYESHAFITNDVKAECVLERPYIFLTEQKVLYMRDLLPLLEYARDNGRPLLLIAEQYDPEVIQNLAMNKLHGIISVCAVKAPAFGEYRKKLLQDLAILTDGVCLTYDSNIYVNNAKPEMLGSCDKAIITKDYTTLIAPSTKETVKMRVEAIKQELSEAEDENTIDFHKRRIASLVGGIASIKVGGVTELEMKEKKDRVDDAVCAVQAAAQEGIIVGGGLSFVGAFYEFSGTISPEPDEYTIGQTIVLNGLFSVFNRILKNCGESTDGIFDKIDPISDIGYDANNGTYVNMYKAGIINPVKADRLCFENAISVLNLYLSTNCVIVDEKLIL